MVSWVVSRCVIPGGEIRTLEYKGPISRYWRGYSNILVIFWDCMNIFQRLLLFSSSTDQILAVGQVSSCVVTSGMEIWDRGIIVEWISYFLILWGLFKYFCIWKCSREQAFSCLIVIEVCHSVWGFLGPWDIVHRMKVSFIIISEVVLI